MKRSELILLALLVPVDLLMIVAAFLAAYYFRLNVGQVDFVWPIEQYLTFVAILAPVWIVIFALSGLYSLIRTRRFWEELGTILVGVSGGTFLVIAWPFLTRQEFFSRLVVIYLFIFALIFVTFGRRLMRWVRYALYRRGIGVHRLVVVGTNGVTAELVADIASDLNRGQRVVGLLKTEPAAKVDSRLKDIPILGSAEDGSEIFKHHKVDDLLIADSDLPKGLTLKLLSVAEERGINFKVIANQLAVHTNIAVTETAGLPVVEYRRTPLEGWGKIIKRTVDIVGATLLIIVTSPLMILTALLIKLDSRGPVFFTTLDKKGSPSLRVGQYGQMFRYFKFRSMVPGQHWLRYKELAHLDTRSGPLVKLADDPRITRVGKLLRRFSIDELPELFLVLIGQMSLVGPRPHLPEEVAKYKPHQRRVLIMKPGMTGLAQISGRSDLRFEDEVRLDTYYLENWSLGLDLQILLKTPLRVLASRSRHAD